MARPLCWLWAALLLGGCSFRTEVPSGKTIACGAGQACPDGYACRAEVGRCIPVADLAKPPVGVTDPTVEPRIGGPATTFTLRFGVTAPLAGPPLAYGSAFASGDRLESYPFACGACGPEAPCVCTYAPDPARLPPDGPLNLRVEVVDTLGNRPPPVSAGALQFDATPPGLEGPASVTFEAAPGTPVPVDALGNGGAARACFTTTEELAGPPAVAAGPLALALEDGYPEGLHYCYRLAPGAGLADGHLELTAAMTDRAGNSATVPLLGAGLEVLASPPPAPDLGADGGLRYRRAPWGDQDDPTPRFALAAEGPALPVDGWLVAYADPQAQVELARAPVRAGPLAPLALPGADHPEVFVELFDRAGNRTAGGPHRVREVDWVATLAHKRAGDLTANPHACFGRPVRGPALLQADDAARELAPDRLPAGAPDGGRPLVGGAGSWRKRSVHGAALRSRAAYDSARGRLVAFNAGEDGRETWEFDGRDWQVADVGLGQAPSLRYGAALAYDAARGETILFGGYDPASLSVLCDTWRWDGRAWRLAAACDPAGPAARDDAALAYDPARRQLVLAGGADTNNAVLGDAWAWDGARWTALPGRLPDGGAAAFRARSGASLAFVEATGRLVLAGGFSNATPGGERSSAEVWAGDWTGSTYAWRKLQASADCDPNQSYCDLIDVATDPAGGVLAVVEPAVDVQAAWHWDGLSDAGWTELPGLDPNYEAMQVLPTPAFAELGSPQVAFYGSGGAPTELHGCRLGPGGRCARLHGQGYDVPPGRSQAALALTSDGRGLLAGGRHVSSQGETTLADAWRWDGNDWSPGPALPSPLLRAGLAWHPTRGEFWLVGGAPDTTSACRAELLSTSATATSWTQRSAAVSDGGLCPGLAWVPDAGMVLAPALDRLGDAPPYALVPTAPPSGSPGWPGGHLLWDSSSGQYLLWDGYFGITTYDPATSQWTNLSALLNTTLYDLGAGVYDPEARAVLALTALPLTAGEATVLRMDGASGVEVPLADPEGDGSPPNSTWPAAVYDASRGESLLVVGESRLGGETPAADTWAFGLARLRPSEACRVDFGAAQAGPAAVERVRVRAQARAAGPDGTPADAVLELWQRGAWHEAARCTAPPCPLEADLTDPAAAAALLRDRDLLGVQVTPGALNGPDLSAAGLDALEVQVSYRLP